MLMPFADIDACAGAGVDARTGGNVDTGFGAMAGIGTGVEEVADRWRDGEVDRDAWEFGKWEWEEEPGSN
jgi:hypothetical protein